MVSGAERGVQVVLYSGASVAFAKTFWYMIYEFPTPINQTYGSHFQYLTILGLSVTFFAQVVGIFAALLNCSKLRAVKQSLDVICAPVEFLISILYWSIKMVDPGLLIDPRIALVPPLWLDVCMHFLPSIVELIDVVFFHPQWTMSVLASVGMFSPFVYAYWVWIHFTYKKNGFFPYPMLEMVTTSQRIQIFVVSGIILALCQQAVRIIQKATGKPDPKLAQKKNA